MWWAIYNTKTGELHSYGDTEEPAKLPDELAAVAVDFEVDASKAWDAKERTFVDVPEAVFDKGATIDSILRVTMLSRDQEDALRAELGKLWG